MVCILGMGDCGNKSSSAYASNVNNINKSMFNMTNKVGQTTNVTNVNSQTLQFTNGKHGVVKGCNITFNQIVKADQDIKVTLNVTNLTDLREQISNTLKQDVQSSSNQKTAYLQTASNENVTSTTMNETIDNLVSKTIDNPTFQTVHTMLQNLQHGKFENLGKIICTPGQNAIVISQEIVSKQIADILTRALTGTTVDELIISSSDFKGSSNTDQVGGGVADAISSLFKGIGGVITNLFDGLSGLLSSPSGIIMIIVIIVVLYIVIFKKPGVKKATAVNTAVATFGKLLFGKKR